MCLVKKKSLLKKFENTGYYTKCNGLFSVMLNKYITVVHQLQEKTEMIGEEKHLLATQCPFTGTWNQRYLTRQNPCGLRVLKRDYVVPSTHRLMK